MNQTPTLTAHARRRCVEMEISTKVAKFIVKNADLRYPSQLEAMIAVCDEYPKYAVVYMPEQPPLIITVVFRSYDNYDRDGSNYILRKP